MIILHYIVRFFHTEFFIKRYRFIIDDQVYGDILFAACNGKCRFHQTGADPLMQIRSVHAQICYIQPISIIR